MANKPKIQYVGQFYIYGSEAQKLEEKKNSGPKSRLPLPQLGKNDTVSLDPVALVGIAVAIFLLVAMVVGLAQLKTDWREHERLSSYVSQLNRENAELSAAYRENYDLEDIQKKALGLGMVEKTEATSMTVYVSVPEKEAEPTLWDDIVWFWQGLFA